MFSSNSSQVSSAANYIEDVFSTYLYTGTGAAQTITNNIDLSTYGGLVWFKNRTNVLSNGVFDSARGITKLLYTNTTASNVTTTDTVTSFNTNGFSLGVDSGWGGANGNVSDNYVSWTFRKQAKFFDVVTYTGDGVAGRAIAHNLGSTPGCIIIKRTSAATAWAVYHRSVIDTDYKVLTLNDTTAVSIVGDEFWSISNITSTTFGVGTSSRTNQSGSTYVAYLFAHNAGGFGLAGTDNVISCGSFTTDGSGNATVNLGYEPQWVLWKSTASGYWAVFDNMRGMPSGGTNGARLFPNSTDAEDSNGSTFPTATGFQTITGGIHTSETHIYIAIRRGPMKVPTLGTSVFAPTYVAGTGSPHAVTGGSFPPDLFLSVGNSNPRGWYDRLRGNYLLLQSSGTFAEFSSSGSVQSFNMNGVTVGADSVDFTVNSSGNYSQYYFGRAPSFFDEVCYTGTGTYTGSINHNLGVVPEFCIFRNRASVANWWCYHSGLPYPASQGMILNSTSALTDYYPTSVWGGTSTTFITTNAFGTNQASNYVAYLFATCAGVSKVGSYTGNGGTQAIACGFTGGARFVLIKCTSATGGWYTYDTARGMTTLTDPYFFLNNTNNQQASLGSVTTTTGGFTLNASILSAINTSSETYIFLAIA